ncbi:hypothetical protein LNP04_09435 [Chryseobacterium sp. C-71]|uniref:DUF6705 family protein n=1 Tax=Chryseobacterium sp. C-71 TaxID=2893882 RepID=UPI001E546B25|nr:DUF6705 family protein [Chryseobacterium sp. C-71]UFH33898.1 hypothetical protein LNP04_09435 [Chryseobacterium sp. C-71]
MKNILILIIFISALSCKAQSTIIDIVNECNDNNHNYTNGSVYLKDISNVYQPFIGTWKWTEGNREMTLVLIKQTKHNYNDTGNDNYYEDRLVGYYIYKENGVTLIDTSNDNLQKDFGITVNFQIYCNNSDNVHTVFFTDIPKNKDYEVKLEKLSPTQIKFNGKMGQYSIMPSKIPKIIHGGYSFPLEMTFTKQ